MNLRKYQQAGQVQTFERMDMPKQYQPKMVGTLLPQQPRGNATFDMTEFGEKPNNPWSSLLSQAPALLTSGLNTLSSLSKNTYENANKQLFMNRSAMDNISKNLYTTNQDRYGTSYARFGGRFQQGGELQDAYNRQLESLNALNIINDPEDQDIRDALSYGLSRTQNSLSDFREKQTLDQFADYQRQIESQSKQIQELQSRDPQVVENYNYDFSTPSDLYMPEDDHDHNHEEYVSPNGIPNPNVGFKQGFSNDLSSYGAAYKNLDSRVTKATQELIGKFPSLRLTSGRRSWGDKDAHPKGRAVDLSYDPAAYKYYRDVIVPKYGFNPALDPDHGTGLHIHLGYYQDGGEFGDPHGSKLTLSDQFFEFGDQSGSFKLNYEYPRPFNPISNEGTLNRPSIPMNAINNIAKTALTKSIPEISAEQVSFQQPTISNNPIGNQVGPPQRPQEIMERMQMVPYPRTFHTGSMKGTPINFQPPKLPAKQPPTTHRRINNNRRRYPSTQVKQSPNIELVNQPSEYQQPNLLIYDQQTGELIGNKQLPQLRQMGGKIYGENTIDPGHKELTFPNGLQSSTPLNTYVTNDITNPQYQKLMGYYSKGYHRIAPLVNDASIISTTSMRDEVLNHPEYAPDIKRLINNIPFQPDTDKDNVAGPLREFLTKHNYKEPYTQFDKELNNSNKSELNNFNDFFTDIGSSSDYISGQKSYPLNDFYKSQELYYKGEELKDDGHAFIGWAHPIYDIPYPLYQPAFQKTGMRGMNSVGIPKRRSNVNMVGRGYNIPQQTLPPQRGSLSSLSQSYPTQQNYRPNMVGRQIQQESPKPIMSSMSNVGLPISNYKPQLTGNTVQSTSPRLGLNSLENVDTPTNNYKPQMTGSTVPMVSPSMPVDNSQMTPLDIYDRRGNFLRTESIRRDDHGYVGRKKYSPRGGNNYIDVGYPIKQKGGIITDPLGQYAHPGKITNIPSNNITMKGIPYPVLGISDTGDTKLMQPNMNYNFKGKSVLEFPIFQKGGGYQWQQQNFQPLNFNGLNQSNYNVVPVVKPAPIPWGDKSLRMPKGKIIGNFKPTQKAKQPKGEFIPLSLPILPQPQSTYAEVNAAPYPFFEQPQFSMPPMTRSQFINDLSNAYDRRETKSNEFWMNPYLNYITSPNPFFNPFIKNLSRKDKILATLTQPKRKSKNF